MVARFRPPRLVRSSWTGLAALIADGGLVQLLSSRGAAGRIARPTGSGLMRTQMQTSLIEVGEGR
jgi:hypothetical protein